MHSTGMAVESGFTYFSFSSSLIIQLKTTSFGVQVATKLETITLLSNICHEIFALIDIPNAVPHSPYQAKTICC